MIILGILKMILICYVLVDLTSLIGQILSTLPVKNKVLGVVKVLFEYLLTCEKCSSFWITLIITGDIFTSALVAISIKIIKMLENKFIKTEL